MSLSDKLEEALNQEPTTTACKIGSLLKGSVLSDEDKTTLAKLLAVPEGTPKRLTNAAIARVLRDEGFDISNSAVDRHRRTDCACSRKVSA
jgi:hypothetical protein